MAARKQSERRGYSRKVGTLLPPATKKVFRKYGFAEGAVVRQWREVAGAKLADCTLPLKISWGREKGEKIAILHLLVEPAAALEVQHQIPLLLEKLKIFYGNGSIAKIALVQGKRPARKGPRPAEMRPPDPGAHETMETWTAAMKDAGLKSSLIRLGEQILIEEEK